MDRRVGTVLAVVLAIALGALLLWPDGWMVNRLVVRVYVVLLDLGVPPSVRPEHYAAALNVLVFVPLGWLGVSALRRPAWLVVAVLAGASAVVETVQLWPGLGREASLFDVACNTLGAGLGALAASAAARRRPGDEHAGGDEALDERRHPGRDELG